MANIVRLPAVLPAAPELEALNSLLKAQTVILDWTDVVNPPEPALAILLKDIELDTHAQVLGLDTVPDALAERIGALTETKAKHPTKGKRKARKQAAKVFSASGESATEDVTAPPEEPPQPQKVLRVASQTELRQMLADKVVADLLGPAQGPSEEVDESRVSERYLVGMLAAHGVAAEVSDELGVQEGEGDDNQPADPGVDTQAALFPSSFGLSFCVAAYVRTVYVTARWGWYRREKSETLLSKTGAPKTVWKRYPMAGTVEISLAEGLVASIPVVTEQPGVVIRGVVRRVDQDFIVSLFLVNGQQEPKELKDQAWLFQAELSVDCKGQPVFQRRARHRISARLDLETRTEAEAMAMLYRRHPEFAVGHGVATHAEPDPKDPTRAVRICTVVVPVHDVAQQRPPDVTEIPGLAALVLDMKTLSECSATDLQRHLESLPVEYEAWIGRETARVEAGQDDLAEHKVAAREALGRCRRALARIRDGLQLVTTDTNARQAFQFANRSMWQQRVRSLYAEGVRRGKAPKLEDIDIPLNRTWYPFQLAFIFLNIPGLTQLDHPDRTADDGSATADLLWFPTGGGKTEAYLGLTAYTLAIRRLQGAVEGRPGDLGVAVLMRYTLRLLTLQQFQRASTLICACETIRRSDPDLWGQEPFRIGLWVGYRTTPNTTEDAAESLKQAHGFFTGGALGTPAQLKHCPWCGSQIEPGRDIEVRSFKQSSGRTLIFCSDRYGRCAFSRRNSPDEGIPAVVVDEEIYRRLPALVIATVDKFAQMPWRGAVRALFGEVSQRCERHGFRYPDERDDHANSHPKTPMAPEAKTRAVGPLRPPDLIIQDELHLISGPLGTLTGLYETAIDELCTWTVNGHRVRPKVVASTATIRRARVQVHQLFLRDVAVFPPHGVDVGDSFFARERDTSVVFGRRYLGICAPGRRLKATLIRVYVAYLSAAQQLFNDYGEAADPWMTLVGYFTSLRELAGMVRLVQDDVRSRVRDMDQRGLASRRLTEPKELTSRKSSADIPTLLDELEVKFKTPTGLPAQPGARYEQPIDVLLATNMLSVGVDVKRLGLMVVAGQPKATAEYIQATSRVGRSFPGLVCTIYNWARPRDLSHYETFEHYHQTFYKHVEALSLTPFASRALDRGLSGVFVALTRLAGGGLSDNDAAGGIHQDLEVVQRAIAQIRHRAEVATGSKDVGEQVQKMLERRLDRWCTLAQFTTAGVGLGYRPQKGRDLQALLRETGTGRWEDFTCPNSLRDVEPTVSLVLDNSTDQAVTPKGVW
jgi:ribosomal protein L24E